MQFQICVKRGPLGACQKTETRTAENDNDKASKYFRDPAETMKEKYSAAQLQAIDNGESAKAVAPSEGNELIEKLKQASLDNKDKNDRIVRAKTLQNNLVSNEETSLTSCDIIMRNFLNYLLLFDIIRERALVPSTIRL
jgi:SpoVK/Ycf46/Vps4 family AAA+-type ATPase